MNLSDEIKKLHELHQSGVLTYAEFEQAKKKLLESDGAQTSSESLFGSSSGSFGSTGSAGSSGSSSAFSRNSSSDSAFNASFKKENSQDGIYQLNQFRRSKSDRWLGGVCGGIAKSTGLDTWIWRLIFIFFLCFGIGFLAYLLAWIIIPEED